MRSILLMNGPNLDMLGKREPGVYGSMTLAELEGLVAGYAGQRDIAVSRFQSNSEGDLINAIQYADGQFDGIVYNPGAHTHYSYALRDAIAGIGTPTVEVHLSDIDAREAFRRISVTAPACVAQVKGLGVEGYYRAIDILCDMPEFKRLGEGYEQHFPEGANVKVAGGELPATVSEEVAQSGADQAQSANPMPPESAGEELAAIGDAVDSAGQDADGAHDAETQEAAAEACSPAESDAAAEEIGALSAAASLAEAGESSQAEPDLEPDSESAALRRGVEDFTEPYASEVNAENAGAESARRLQLIREASEKLAVDSFLVRDTSNIRWATAVDGAFDEERAHALLVAADGTYLHTDTRYSNAVRSRLAAMESPVQVSDERIGHMAFARNVLFGDAGAYAGRMAIEDTITYAEYVKAVEALGIPSLAASTDTVLGLRAVKTPAELVRLRAAQAVTDAAFVHIVEFMRPGMTEREVQLELEDYMLRHGAEGLAFSSIVATGANGADPHAIPGATALEAGQCVVMDFGAKAFGYCSDMTRVVFLGQPDERLASAWEVLRRANETVEAQLRPGMTGKEAHELAEQVLAEGGYAGRMGHGLGHGVGLDVHELPVLNTRNDHPLEAGNVVTVEPGIYVPGEFGMRLEDCGVLTEEGYQPFSQIDHEMVVV